MIKKKGQAAVLMFSAAGASATLFVANRAEALNRMWLNSGDILANFVTKSTSTSSGFSLSGINGYGTTTGYAYRSGGTIYANVQSQGGSMYVRGYGRCYSSSAGVYSAVYSDYTTDTTFKSISCSSLPSGAGPWSLQGWGVSVLSFGDNTITTSNRNVCDGQGCGAPDSLKICTRLLNNYPALNTSHEAIGGIPGVSVPGPASEAGCC